MTVKAERKNSLQNRQPDMNLKIKSLSKNVKTIQYSERQIANIQTQFRHALHLGTGKAIRLIKEHCHLDFSQYLIYATMNKMAFVLLTD